MILDLYITYTLYHTMTQFYHWNLYNTNKLHINLVLSIKILRLKKQQKTHLGMQLLPLFLIHL